ncbi:MAG: ornithine carbamoyltransferase [Planctomycetota bacterium]
MSAIASQTNVTGTTTLQDALAPLAGTDFLSILDVTTPQLLALLELAEAVKAEPALLRGTLAGKTVVMLFEKPSLRTRVSFEVGLVKAGAHALYFDHKGSKIGDREPVLDYAKNMERWCDAIVARTFSHETLEGLASHGSIPVVNALSDLYHPCQALADLLTLKEHLGTLEGKKLAYLGDGNNVCHSLMIACAKSGVDFTAVTPKGFEPSFGVIKRATAAAVVSGAKITVTHDPQAVEAHHAVYTDTWVSMGQDHQHAVREGQFAHLSVGDGLMEKASTGINGTAKFMHCLPAHRGQEVSDTVIDGPDSVVYDQAENRMHTQVALLLALFGAVPGVSGVAKEMT